MKNLRKLLIGLILSFLVFCVFPGNILAGEGLVVTYLGDHLSGPVFSFDDFKPGDCLTRVIKVKNKGSSSKQVFIKSDVTHGDILSNVTDFKIFAGSTLVYGPVSLSQFFSDSGGSSGLFLSSINKVQEISFTFTACFDINAGNEYQNTKVVFNLSFLDNAADHVVINEVFYNVDATHGLEKSGSDSKNIFEIQIFNFCIVVQKNFNNIIIGSDKCDSKKGQNDEWVELYNPTDSDISLKNWVLIDDSGTEAKITANKKIKAHDFALLSKSTSTWSFWNENPDAIKIELGGMIGDGLGNIGDHLILKNPSNVTVDKVGWGSDTIVWTSSQPSAIPGNTIERLTPGFDFDLPSDWLERIPPTPGN